MKNLIIINGAMGVGKTATGMALQKIMPRNVFLDGDWCWNMEPFIVNEETRKMVLSNIVYLLNSFLRCSEYENIIFCWVMHEQRIIDDIVSRLELRECRQYVFSLTCSEEALTQRIKADIADGKRGEDVLGRSLSRLPLYDKIASIKIDVSRLSPAGAAEIIKHAVAQQ